jgi:hypothetical protein
VNQSPTKETEIVTDHITSVTKTRDTAPIHKTAGQRMPMRRIALATLASVNAKTPDAYTPAPKVSDLVDVRAELVARLGGLNSRSPLGVKLTDGIAVYNTGAAAGEGWKLRVALPAIDAGPDEVLALAARLHAAALDTHILNSISTVSVNFRQGARNNAVHGDTVRLYSQTEAAGTSYRFEKGSGRTGRRWGDDEFSFEIVGNFTYIGDETRGGVTRALLAQLPALQGTEARS